MTQIKMHNTPYAHTPVQDHNNICCSFGILQTALQKCVNTCDVSLLIELSDLSSSLIKNELRPTLIPVIRDVLYEYEKMINDFDDVDDDTIFTPTEFNNYVLGILLATDDMLKWYTNHDVNLTIQPMLEHYLQLTQAQLNKIKHGDKSSENYRLHYRYYFVKANLHQFNPETEINTFLHSIQVGDTISIWNKQRNKTYRAYVEFIEIDESITYDTIGYDPIEEDISPLFFYVTPIYDSPTITDTSKKCVDPLAIQAVIYHSDDIVVK